MILIKTWLDEKGRRCGRINCQEEIDGVCSMRGEKNRKRRAMGVTIMG